MSNSKLEQTYCRQLNDRYLVERRLGEGGYGITFLASDRTALTTRVVIKLPNLDLSRNREDLKKRLKEFDDSLDAEFEGMSRLNRVHGVAHVVRVDECALKVEGDRLRIPFLVQEYVSGRELGTYFEGPRLRHKINYDRTRQRRAHSHFGGIRLPRFFYEFASQLVTGLAGVHRQGVVHGDLWPPNILVNSRGEPIIIDFGQSLLIDYIFLAGGKQIDHSYAAPERRLPNAQWSSSADIYSLGGILYFLSTGEDPPAPISDREELKIEICKRIRDLNPHLYLANSGIADVIARCLRCAPSDRPSFAEGVLGELSLFLDRPKLNLTQSVRSLTKSANTLKKGPSDVFTHISNARVQTLTRQFSEMKAGLYTLAGHNEDIIRGLVEMLSLLEYKDSYLTVSIPSFWSQGPDGLGINGRFLEMNKIAAQNGVSIGRVFLVKDEDSRLESIHSILKAHLRVIEELEARRPTISTEKWLVAQKKPGYYIGVLKDDDVIRRSLDLTNFGVWSKAKKNQDILIAPQYREKEKEVAAVRFWAPTVARERIAKLKARALELIEASTPLREWLQSISRPPINRSRSPRFRGDERIPVAIEVSDNLAQCGSTEGPLNARIVDHSGHGLGLRVFTPVRQNHILRAGTKLRLLQTPPHAIGTWARKFWRTELEIVWMTDTTKVPWRAGLRVG